MVMKWDQLGCPWVVIGCRGVVVVRAGLAPAHFPLHPSPAPTPSVAWRRRLFPPGTEAAR